MNLKNHLSKVNFLVKPACCVHGRISLLGDKSIAHRAIILSAITSGRTRIDNFPANQDCLLTAKAFEKLGVKITYNFSKHNPETGNIIVTGVSMRGLTKPKGAVFAGDSGTTLRVILGILSGQIFTVKLSAGKFLSKRPMKRVIIPLRMMGAKINSKCKTQNSKLQFKIQNQKWEEYPPLIVQGGDLKAITYKMPVASAQVKSAILLAGLYAKGTTRVIEKFKTRDHTERMLRLFKAGIKIGNNTVSLTAGKNLVSPGKIYVPGDISSASFFIVLAAVISGSRILLRKVSLNPTRTGIINVLKRMGADIKVISHPRCHSVLRGRHSPVTSSEPMGDVEIKSSSLIGTIVNKKEIPLLIDELPVLMVAACFARGRTIFEGVRELRVKETDRIKSMSENLAKMGADISIINKGRNENIIIRGTLGLNGAKVKSFSDHRTAMSMIIAGLCSKGNTEIDDVGCINKSFPNFIKIINNLAGAQRAVPLTACRAHNAQ